MNHYPSHVSYRVGPGGHVPISVPATPPFVSPPTLSGLTLLAWWDPRSSNYSDTARTVPASLGTAVASVADLAGSGYHLSQSTVSKRPQLIAGPNGVAAWSADGSDDGWTSLALPTTAQPITIVGLIAITSTAASSVRLFSSAGSTNARMEVTPSAALHMYAGGTSASIGSLGTSGVWHSFAATFDGAGSIGRFDGAETSVGSGIGTNGIQNNSVGVFCNAASTGNFLCAKTGPMLIFTGSADAAKRTQLELWLRTGYGL